MEPTMPANVPSRSKDRFLYGALIVYLICFIAISPGKADLDLIRMPGFSILLLILIQVIFPQFRFSKTANLIAALSIPALPVFFALTTP